MGVRHELEDSVMWITLDRPDRLNAIDLEMQRQLRAALEAAAQPEVRCVVLTGAGRAFCVGQDLDEFQGMSEKPRSSCASTTTPMCSLYGGWRSR